MIDLRQIAWDIGETTMQEADAVAQLIEENRGARVPAADARLVAVGMSRIDERAWSGALRSAIFERAAPYMKPTAGGEDASQEDLAVDAFTTEEWAEVKLAALKLLAAAALDTPENHLAYLRERIAPRPPERAERHDRP